MRRTQGVLGGRSDQVVRRVLDAAIAELAYSGYAGFRMDEVVAKAAVNKTTIYRRWPSRAALVTAVVERMRAPLRATPLPDTGALERDLVEAFTRRFNVGRKIDGRAWARLLHERYSPEVKQIIKGVVDERGGEWRAMVTRAIARGEVPPKTDAQLLLHLVRAIMDARPGDPRWSLVAIRTVIAGARAGTLVSVEHEVRLAALDEVLAEADRESGPVPRAMIDKAKAELLAARRPKRAKRARSR